MKTKAQTKAGNGHLQSDDPRAQRETPAPEGHPLAGVIGGFADDPLWDEFVEQMKQERPTVSQSEGKAE